MVAMPHTSVGLRQRFARYLRPYRQWLMLAMGGNVFTVALTMTTPACPVADVLTERMSQ